MASPITRAAEEFSQAVSNFEPQGPNEMVGAFDGMPDAMEELTSAVAGLVSRAQSEMPIEPGTKSALDDLLSSMSGLRGQAEDVARRFRQDHESELNRIENPRPNERLWDVTQNQ